MHRGENVLGFMTIQKQVTETKEKKKLDEQERKERGREDEKEIGKL